MVKNLLTTVLIALLAVAETMSLVRAEMVKEVTPSQDSLLARYEPGDRLYQKLQIDNVVSYFHQRQIGEAIVEKDFMRYQFDVDTEELIEKEIRWREGLPDRVIPVITREQAESMVEGVVQFTRLYIISPESDVFPIRPAPKNPCWVIRSVQDERLVVTIIDAMTGERLGYGIPPPSPSTGFSLGGPNWGSCDPYYTAWAKNAETWFERMGYNTEMVDCPGDAKVQSQIQSDLTAMFYELAHGGYWSFHNECPDDHRITAGEVEAWINSYASMPFTFLGSCEGMCYQANNTLSYEFRKGSNRGTVAVGYCGMSSEACAECWGHSKEWQNTLFDWMNKAYTVGYAFTSANLAYPCCASGSCMRVGGDAGLSAVPILTRSICGIAFDGSGGPLTMKCRDYYIRCNTTVPLWRQLTIDGNVR